MKIKRNNNQNEIYLKEEIGFDPIEYNELRGDCNGKEKKQKNKKNGKNKTHRNNNR